MRIRGADRLSRWALALLLVVLAYPAAASSVQHFRSGISDLDLKRWQQAADWLEQAIAENPRESAKRVIISGVFSKPYLPHYFLGLALAEVGGSSCDQALDALAESERQGVIGKLEKELAGLREARSRCLDQVWPAVLGEAEKSVAEASTLARQLASPFALPSLEEQRTESFIALEQAREKLVAGRESRALNEVKEARLLATRAAESLRQLTLEIARSASSGRSTSQDREQAALSARQAWDSARQALVSAQEARSELASWLEDSRNQALRRQYPELAMPEGALSRLEAVAAQILKSSETGAEPDGSGLGAQDPQALAALKRQADTVASEVSQVRILARSLSAAMEREARSTPPPLAVVSDDGVPELPRPSAQDSASLQEPFPGPETTVDTRLLILAGAAQELLPLIESNRQSRLLEAQRERLRSLVDLAAGASPPNELPDRLAESVTALQILAGADALFDGRSAAAERILSIRALPSSRLGAHGLLLRAAARFALAQLAASPGSSMIAQAERDIRRCRALATNVEVRSPYFSSAFRTFFEAVEPAG